MVCPLLYEQLPDGSALAVTKCGPFVRVDELPLERQAEIRKSDALFFKYKAKLEAVFEDFNERQYIATAVGCLHAE